MIRALRIGLMAVCVSMAGVAPLTREQTQRLNAASDDAEYREDAFLALVENVRLWADGIADAAVRLNLDVEKLMAKPSDFRGELWRLQGRLDQQSELPAPFEDFSEWFIRTPPGIPVVIYVKKPRTPMRIGDDVEVFARFFKRLSLVARDGTTRQYA